MVKTQQYDIQERNLLIRVINVLYSTDVFRCVFLALTATRILYVYGIYDIISPYIDYVIIPWGFSILLRDIITERNFLRNKHIWFLIFFLICYLISLLVNHEYLSDNLMLFLYMIIFTLVICPADIKVKPRNKYWFIFTFCVILVVPVTILSILSLLDYMTTEYSYIPIRLSGHFGNPNRAGWATYLSVSLSIVCWILLSKITSRKSVIVTGRLFTIILVIINYSMLVLSDTRTSILSLLTFVMIFTFFAMLRCFLRKGISATRSCIVAVITAILMTCLTLAADKPIRYAAGVMRTAVMKEITFDASSGIYQESMSLSIVNPIVRSTFAELAQKDEDVIADETDTTEIEVVQGRDISFFVSDDRAILWEYSIRIALRHPIFGVSRVGIPGELIEINNERTEPDNREYAWLPLAAAAVTYNSMHGFFFELAAANGIPALILLLLFLALSLISYAKMLISNYFCENYYIVCCIIALCAGLLSHQLFSSVFYIVDYHPVIFWSCLSFAGSLLQSEESSV